MPAARRRDFDRKVEDLQHANGHTAALAEALRHELLATGAADRTRELVADFLDQASTAAGDAALPRALGAGMGELLRALRRQYFAQP
jgi:hypothetical protein